MAISKTIISKKTDNRKLRPPKPEVLISANFDAICHDSRDISISALGGYISISGCRLLL